MKDTRQTHRPQEPSRSARAEAEARLAQVREAAIAIAPDEIQRLMRELAVHQVELEMQNEELRRTQASLEAARARYFGFYDQAPVAYLVVGRANRILEANRGAAELLRGAPSRLVGRALDELLLPSGSSQFIRRQDEVIGTGVAQSFEFPMRRLDGSVFWAQVLMNGTHQDPEEEDTIRIALTDVTERKRMGDEANRLAAIVNSSDQAIFSQHLTGEIASWNPAAEKLFGYAATEILGLKLSLLFPRDRIPEESTDRDLVREGRRVAHESVRIRRDGSTFPVHASVAPIVDAEGRVTGASHITRDISHELATRDRLGARLRNLQENQDTLRQDDRRKDEFIAMLAHELRNPLAPIRNAAAALRYGPTLDPKVEWCRDVIDRQVTHMATLLDDLLDVSRITRNAIALHTEVVELTRPITQALEITRPLVEGRAHTLVVDLPAKSIPVMGDVTRLTQVFGNLLNNAAKYTDRGGRIRLGVELLDGVVEVRVRDSGIGIDPAHLPEIFEMFSQLDRSGDRQGGLGIGLSLVKALVEMHGGSVAAYSAGKGRGSEFLVRLPVLDGREGAAASAAPEFPETPPIDVTRIPQGRVLVVDDNRDAAESLGQLLSLHGYEIRTAGNGEEAIEIARVYRPDVAILDLGLPGMGGLEVGRRIREESWGRPVLLIACTGWGQPEDQHRTQEAGFDHHLVKPVNLQHLLRLLSSRSAPEEPDASGSEA